MTIFAPNGNHIVGVVAESRGHLMVDEDGNVTDSFVRGDSPTPVEKEGELLYRDVKGGEWTEDEIVRDPDEVTVKRLEDGETRSYEVSEVVDGIHDDRQLFIDNAALDMGAESVEEIDSHSWEVTLR